MPLTPSSSRYHGPVPQPVWEVLAVAWEQGIAIQSDFARTHAAEVSLAASCGWLSSIDPLGHTFCRHWRITASGLLALQNKENFPAC